MLLLCDLSSKILPIGCGCIHSFCEIVAVIKKIQRILNYLDIIWYNTFILPCTKKYQEYIIINEIQDKLPELQKIVKMLFIFSNFRKKIQLRPGLRQFGKVTNLLGFIFWGLHIFSSWLFISHLNHLHFIFDKF